MRTLAVLPVKSFGSAKRRLGDAVAADERRELAAAMARDVLDALATVRGLDGVIVVTATEGLPPATGPQRPATATGPQRPATATSPGGHSAPGPGGHSAASPGGLSGAAHSAAFVEVVHDALESGQSPAAGLGIRAAVERGAERVLLVPGDCPALDPGEVDGLLAGAEPGVTIVPDRHGSGTNALLIAPPSAVAPAFGPGSFARHAALARAAGARVRVAHLPSLELDVDTPEDLEALRATLAARPGGAVRTRERLERLVPAPA